MNADEFFKRPDINLSAPSVEDMQAEMAAAHDLAESEGIPFISALIIAKDRQSAERSKRWVQMGLDAGDAYRFVGSYARLDFVMWCVEERRQDKGWLLDNLPSLWRDSDPDDTDPRWLALWQEASMRGGLAHTVFDVESPLLRPKWDEWVKVYRGQLDDDVQLTYSPIFGIAWTTDPTVARKFAHTGGLRGVHGLPGRVYERWVNRADILAYLTLRGESEVIVDPANLSDISPEEGAWLADGWLERAQG